MKTALLALVPALLIGCASKPGDSHAGHPTDETGQHGGHGTAALFATTEPSPPAAGQRGYRTAEEHHYLVR